MKPKFLFFFIGILFVFSSCTYEDIEVTNITNYSVNNVTDDGFELAMDITISNPNNYKMKMKWAKMDVYINDRYIGKTNIDEDVILKAQSNDEHRVKMKTSYDKAFKGSIMDLAASALFGGGIKLKVEGEMKGSAFLISRKFPIEHTETIKFSELDF